MVTILKSCSNEDVLSIFLAVSKIFFSISKTDFLSSKKLVDIFVPFKFRTYSYFKPFQCLEGATQYIFNFLVKQSIINNLLKAYQITTPKGERVQPVQGSWYFHVYLGTHVVFQPVDTLVDCMTSMLIELKIQKPNQLLPPSITVRWGVGTRTRELQSDIYHLTNKLDDMYQA